MRNLFFVLLSYILLSVSADNNNFGQNTFGLLGQGLQTVQNIKHPIDATVTNLGSSSLAGVETVRKGIRKEIQAVKQPIDQTVVVLGFSQCKHVKKLIGVAYEQLEGDYEPNLNNLQLVYKTRGFTTLINITAAAESLRHARKYDADERLVIFLHGFIDDPTKDGFSNISQSFLDSGSASVMALDASSLIRYLYFRSSTYVRFIGQKLGQTLANLVYEGQDPSLIHIIGHSLGAHISGFTGKTFQKLTGKRIGRISGLDPAGPCFTQVESDLRLEHTDADFVDVMHTDADVYGISEAIGHKDFYVNSGKLQPNCLLQTCSHSRAWLLYGESVVNPTAFPAVRCSDWEAFKKGDCDSEISYMGYPAEPGTKGNYYLQTAGDYPYGLGLDGTKYASNEGIIQRILSFLG